MMIYSGDNTIMNLVKLVTYISPCLEKYLECYYKHYMEQLANTQVFQELIKNSIKITLPVSRNISQKLSPRVWNMQKRQTRVNIARFTTELIHIPERDHGLENLMQVNLLPEPPPSEVYENIITAIDVFLKFAFA